MNRIFVGDFILLGTDGFVDAMASQATASARSFNLTIYFTAVLPGSCSSNLAVPLYCQ